MIYRVFMLAIILSLLNFCLPTLTKQTVIAGAVNLENESTVLVYHNDTYKSTTDEIMADANANESFYEISKHQDSTVQLSNSIVSKEIMGRIVPSECVTGKGMFVEGNPQTGSHFIKTLFVPGILVILAGIIYLKKRA